MPWGDIGTHSLALAAYPGALTLLVVGAIAEWGAVWALLPERVGIPPAGRSVLAAMRPGPLVSGSTFVYFAGPCTNGHPWPGYRPAQAFTIALPHVRGLRIRVAAYLAA